MVIFVPKETYPNERRAPLVPDTAARLAKRGAEIVIESGVGVSCGHPDEAYEKAGASVTRERLGTLGSADMVLRLRKPPLEEISRLKKGCIHISFLDPFDEKELVMELSRCGVSAICLELIPRVTRAQKMDALSSQASLAGYTAVILAAERLPKVFPMMMTPAGTIAPTRVFVIGVGVAGLQAIATAKRLGARVEAFDTRPAVEEQVRSLGARFLRLDLGETGQTRDGYATELTEEQKERQRRGMAKACAESDVVITTAQVFGRRAPLLLTRDMIRGMKRGSIVVDMAVETGGNVEGAELDREVESDGVRIVGLANLPGRVAVHASQMYSSNLGSLIEEYWEEKERVFRLRLDDEIINGCLLTHEGQIRHEGIRRLAER
jgi:NAD(P) transhydrogenase subunit alpha